MCRDQYTKQMYAFWTIQSNVSCLNRVKYCDGRSAKNWTDVTQCNGWNTGCMHASVMISSCNGYFFTMAMMKKAKLSKDENQKSIKEKLNVEQSHTLGNWEQGWKFRCKVIGPNPAQRWTLFYVEWVQVQSPFLVRTEWTSFFVHTCIDRVPTRFKNFLEKHWSLHVICC